jgi:biotin transport system substrate-specific component
MTSNQQAEVLRAVVLPRSGVINVVLVGGFALLTALSAQVIIPLPFTPVPITGQTFAVLLSGAVLGSTLGASSQILYFVLGAVGFPFYAGGEHGWTVAFGATGGYLVGFVVAAWVIGRLAGRRQDRTVATAIPAFLAGNFLIHLFGVPWLAYRLGVSWQEAVQLGSVPFLIGDLAKVTVAGIILPGSWKLIDQVRANRDS